jgi:hypothetical protein
MVAACPRWPRITVRELRFFSDSPRSMLKELRSLIKQFKNWLMANRIRSQRRKEENSSISHTSLLVSGVDDVPEMEYCPVSSSTR